MKLNLGCGADIREQDYVNIDLQPNSQYPSNIYQQGDIQSLDWLCDDKTAEEILALNVLNYMPVAKVSMAIQNWMQKLTINGVLKLSTPDIYALSKTFVENQLSTQDFITAVFGTQQATDNCVSAIDAQTLLRILEECGFTVNTKRYDGFMFYVEASRKE